MKIILLGIIASLSVLLWQNTEALKAAGSSITYGVDEMTLWNGSLDWVGRINPSEANFGMEILQGRPSELKSGITRAYCRQGGGAMTCLTSDIGFTNDSRRKIVLNLIGHENQPQLWQQYFGGTGLPRGPFIVGREGWPSYSFSPQIKSQVQFAIYENKICFAPLYPEAGSVELTILDSCMTRELVNGQPDLKFTAGSKYVLLSELSALLGR